MLYSLLVPGMAVRTISPAQYNRLRATPELKAATLTVAAVVLIAIIALVVSDTNTLITILSGQVGPAGV